MVSQVEMKRHWQVTWLLSPWSDIGPHVWGLLQVWLELDGSAGSSRSAVGMSSYSEGPVTRAGSWAAQAGCRVQRLIWVFWSRNSLVAQMAKRVSRLASEPRPRNDATGCSGQMNHGFCLLWQRDNHAGTVWGAQQQVWGFDLAP